LKRVLKAAIEEQTVLPRSFFVSNSGCVALILAMKTAIGVYIS
jgi:hypothetical protein